MNQIRRWRIKILIVENFELFKINKFFIIILSYSKYSTNNISMRYERICFIFETLNFV